MFDNISNPQQRAFLAAYAEVGTISRAAEVAGIARTTHYYWLKEHEEYQPAFEMAKEAACDLLEAEARRRAVEGVRKLKFHAGKPLTHPETNEPYVEYERSDTLLIFLLKALRPEKYREIRENRHSGSIEHTGSVNVYIPENGREQALDTERVETNGRDGRD